MMAGITSRTDLPALLREDTQFGVRKRTLTTSQKQSHNKENHCEPEVASGCIGCRKQRLENDGLVQKLWRKLTMAWTLLSIIKEVTKTNPAPGVLNASLVRELKSTRPLSKRGPSDNDQHSPAKRRKPSPSSTRTSDLKHINESKHREGTQFGVHLRRNPTRSQKQNQEIHCEQETCKPEVDTGCISCREQRLEIEGLKKVQKLKRRLNMAWELSTIIKEAVKTRPGVLDASLAREFKMMGPVEESRSGWVSAASDVFFGEERFSSSSELGNEKESKADDSHQPVNPPIVHAVLGPSDNDQHSPVKRRKPSPSSTHMSDLKHINESKHREGTCVRRGRKEGSPSCSIRRRLEFRPDHPPDTFVKRRRKERPMSCPIRSGLKFGPDHPPGTSDKHQCSTVERKGKRYVVLHQYATSVLQWSGEASDDIGVMSEKSEVEIKIGVPEDEDLEELGTKIPNEWRVLGRRLMKGTVLDAIHKEEDQLHEKAYAMLVRWKRAKGEGATFSVLYNALCHHLVGRKDLAEEFCCVCHN